MRRGCVYIIALLSLPAASAAQPRSQRARSASREPRARPPSPWWKLATFRVMGGVANVRGGSVESATSWTVDVHAGIRMFDPDRPAPYWIFGGDVGISIGPRGGETTPLWLGGPGIAYGGIWFSAGWSPRFVFGDIAGSTALGIRNTLSGCTFVGFACLDLSHQFLATAQGPQHDIRLSFGLDLGMLAQVIVQFARTRPG